MNSIAIGPLIFSNDRFIAIVTVLSLFAVSEIIAWRRRADRDSIRWWATAIFVIWIITARLGYIIAHWDAFVHAPWTIFAIWQGGFDTRAGTFGLGATIFAAFLSRSKSGFPVLISVLAASAVFALATLFLPDEARGKIPGGDFADLSGAPVTPANRDGRPLVLNLWATWCPPCRREMPMMIDVAGSAEGVEVLFANQGEEEIIIKRFLDLTDLPSHGMIRDPANILMQKFGLLGLPSTLFFAADGSLQAVHTGEISRAALLAGIKDLKGTDNEN